MTESLRQLSLPNIFINRALAVPDDSSTRELRAILLAFRHVYHFQEKSFLILFGSLLSFQAVSNMKHDYPILVKMLEFLLQLTTDGKETAWPVARYRPLDLVPVAACLPDIQSGDVSSRPIIWTCRRHFEILYAKWHHSWTATENRPFQLLLAFQ